MSSWSSLLKGTCLLYIGYFPFHHKPLNWEARRSILENKTHVAYDEIAQKRSLYLIYCLSFKYNNDKSNVDFITPTEYEC